jgi:3-phenylpropionate/trans-cinnamate dioxygenase ferredoxin subunit
MSSSSERWLSVPAGVLAGGRAVIDAEGREILLLRVAGEVHALDNACPHEGNPLFDGEILGDEIECAYHGWRFDLGTGACLVGDEPARRYPTEVRGAEILIRLDADR